MSLEDQLKWDKQHGGATSSSEPPSDFLRQMLAEDAWQLRRGRALDIACGRGRNSVYLAEQGFDVVAVDISPVALNEARARAEYERLSIEWRQADLESAQLEDTDFDLILNINFLQRSLIPRIKRAVKIGGHVIFETYLIDQKEIGHPSNPDYLLRHNELLDHFRDLRVLYYREGRSSENGVSSYRAGILAQRIDSVV
jgi:tellurite methyltransferase